MENLEELKKVFLADDVDEETRKDNEEKIAEWQKSLLFNEAFESWKSSDITKHIIAQLKSSYREFALQIIRGRLLTEEQRKALWAKQDAIAWLMTLVDHDAKRELEQVNSEIVKALDVI